MAKQVTEADALAAIEAFEAYKVLALRGNASYVVTLQTPRGLAQVRGLDERKPAEVLQAWQSNCRLADSIPTTILDGVAQVHGFGLVVARPKDVLSISSLIDDNLVLAEDDGEDDDDDGQDGQQTITHPMLGDA